MNMAPGAIETSARMGDDLTGCIAEHFVTEQPSALSPPDRLLLIWGAEDKAVPLSVGRACQDALGGPRLAIVPEANHCPYLEQPDAFDAALLPFLGHAFGGRG